MQKLLCQIFTSLAVTPRVAFCTVTTVHGNSVSTCSTVQTRWWHGVINICQIIKSTTYHRHIFISKNISSKYIVFVITFCFVLLKMNKLRKYDLKSPKVRTWFTESVSETVEAVTAKCVHEIHTDASVLTRRWRTLVDIWCRKYITSHSIYLFWNIY